MAKSKKKKTTSKARRFLKFLGSALLVIGVISCFILAGMISSFVVDALNFDIEDYQLNLTSSIVYTNEDGDTVEYEKLSSDNNRIWVTIDQIPTHKRRSQLKMSVFICIRAWISNGLSERSWSTLPETRRMAAVPLHSNW